MKRLDSHLMAANNKLTLWFQKQREQHLKTPILDDVFVLENPNPYFWFRMRYFSLKTVLGAAIHIIEYLFLTRIFPTNVIFDLFIVRTFLALLSNFWWGALEPMREQVRQDQYEKNYNTASAHISTWLRRSLIMGSIVLLAGILLVQWSVESSHIFAIIHLYTLGLFVQFALYTYTQTLHSGIYAIQRVRRNMPSLLITQSAHLALIPLLWLWIGQWSLAWVVWIIALLTTGISLYFIHRSYETSKLRPKLKLRLNQKNQPRTSSSFAHGITNLSIRLDSIFFLSVMLGSSFQASDSRFAFIVYLIMPFLTACQEWPQLFYFDLKRMFRPANLNLYQMLVQKVSWLSWIIGISTYLLSLVVILAINPTGFLMALSLAPLFLLKSRLNLFQVRLFCEERLLYATLISGSVAIGLLLISAYSIHFNWRITLISSVIGAGLAIERFILKKGVFPKTLGSILSLPLWSKKLQSCNEPVRLVFVRFSRHLKTNPTSRFSDRLTHDLKARGGHLTHLDRSSVVWFEPAYPAMASDFSVAFSGLASEMVATEAPNGVQALMLFIKKGLLKDEAEAREFQALKQSFNQNFPDGAIWNLNKPLPKMMTNLSRDQKRAILRRAILLAKSYTHRNTSPLLSSLDVSIYAPHGILEAIFITPKQEHLSEESKQLHEWKSVLRSAHRSAAFLNATISHPIRPISHVN